MVGAIAGAAVFSVSTGAALMPSAAKTVAQCLAGAFIACSVERSDAAALPKLIRPAMALLGAVLALNLLLGFLIWWCSPMDLLTSLMCAVPGGMSDTPIIAADLGADAPKVALLQFVRMSAGIGLFPTLIARYTRNEPPLPPPGEERAPRGGGREKTALPFALTLAVSLVCGSAGRALGVPAGTLVFAMAGVIVLKLGWDRAFLPLWAKRLAQVLSGAYIGSGITAADLPELRYLLLPALLLLVGYLCNSLLTGRLLHRKFGFPLKVAMLAATPAGASDMVLISADLGVNSKELVELQLIRMVVVVSVFPQIISVVAALWG